jgi:hypothetical protein
MTPIEQLQRDIAALRKSLRLALVYAIKSKSPERLEEIKQLIGSVAVMTQIFLPEPANSN